LWEKNYLKKIVINKKNLFFKKNKRIAAVSTDAKTSVKIVKKSRKKMHSGGLNRRKELKKIAT
jgi:hypothetical protein